MIMRSYRSGVLAAYLATLVCTIVYTINCASVPTGQAPQTSIYKYGADIVETTASLQRTVTKAALADPRNVAGAKKITGVIDKMLPHVDNLQAFLKAYDAATSLDLKNAEAAKVAEQVAALVSLVTEVFKVPVLEGPVGGEIVALAANATVLYSTITGEIAKYHARLLTVAPTPAPPSAYLVKEEVGDAAA